MGLFGAKNRRTRELAHEVLRPLNLDTSKLKEGSRINFEAEIRRQVDNGNDQRVYDSQKGWKHGE